MKSDQKKSENPWLKIPAFEYEGHMSSPGVLQLQMLSELLKETVEKYNPKSICVPGCAGGNGFEHLADKNPDRVVGIDINPEYISLSEKRYKKVLPSLELICSELEGINFASGSFDLIHAALIFEYVDSEVVLKKFYTWLLPGGILSVLLQLPSPSPVSKTEFESVKILSGFIKLVDPDTFKRRAENLGLELISEKIIEMRNGKKFFSAAFKK